MDSPSWATLYGRTLKSGFPTMKADPTMVDGASSLKPDPVSSSQQAFVSDSREFSCERQTSNLITRQTSKARTLSQRRSLKGRPLPHCGPLRINRWVVLVLYCLYCVFAGPAYINWTPIADILFRAGAFAWLCREEQCSRSATYAAITTAPPLSCRASGNGVAGAMTDGATPAFAADSQMRSMFVVPSPLAVTGLAERGPTVVTRRLGNILTPGTVNSRSGKTLSNVLVAPNPSSIEVTPATESSGSSASLVRCANQEVEVNRLFTITAASHFFFSFIGGTLLDTVGPKVTSLIGLSFALVGWVLLGAASEEIHSYLAGCLFLGAGVDTTYFPLLSGANLFPGHVSTVKAVFGAAASFSFAVPLVLRAIYFSDSVHITHSTLFFCYAAACLGAAVSIAIFVVPWKSWKSPYRSLLSGERQRPNPLSAACGLATQSSQLPTAAADRAFDIIAVHYSRSSLSSPAAESFAASQEESLHDSNSSKGNFSSLSSSPAGRLLDHTYGNNSRIFLQSPVPPLAAACGECSWTSRSASKLSGLSASLSATSGSSRSNKNILSSTSPATFPLRHLSEVNVSPMASASLQALTQVPGNSSGTIKECEHVHAVTSHATPYSSQRLGNRSRKFAAASSSSLMSTNLQSSSKQEASRKNRRCLDAADTTSAAAILSTVFRRCSTPAAVSAADADASTPHIYNIYRSHSAVSGALKVGPPRKPFSKPVSLLKGLRAAGGFHRLRESPSASAAASPRVRTFLGEPKPGGREVIHGAEMPLPHQEGLAKVDLVPFPCPSLSLLRERPACAQVNTRPLFRPDGTGHILCSHVPRPLSPSITPSFSAAFPSACSSSESACSVSAASPSCSTTRGHRRFSTIPLQRPQLVASFSRAPRATKPLIPSTATFSFSVTCKRGGCAFEQHEGERGHDSPRQKSLSSTVPSLLQSTSVTCSRGHLDEEKKEGVRFGLRAIELSANLSPRCSTVSALHTAAPAAHKEQAKKATTESARNELALSGFNEETQRQQTFGKRDGITHMRILDDDDGTVVLAASDAAAAVSHPDNMRENADAKDSALQKSTRFSHAVCSESSMPPLHGNIRGITHPAGASTVVTLFEDESGTATGAGGDASGGLAPALSRKYGHTLAATATDTTTQLPGSAIITPKEAVVAASDNLHLISTVSVSNLDVHATDSFSRLLICFPFKRAHLRRRVSESRHHRWRHFSEKLSSARRDFCSSLFLPIIPFFCVILTGVVFFIPSARHLLPSAYAANRVIQIFSFLPCPLFGHIADVCGIMPVMYICNFCGLLSFAFVMIPQIPAAVPLQYMASLLAASQLSFLVCQICCYVAETFEEENQGKLIGSLCCIAGLTSLSAHYIMDYAVHHGFYKPLVMFITALTFNFLLLAFVHWRKRRTGKLHTPGRVFRTSEPVDEATASAAAQRLKSLPLFRAMSAAAEPASPSLSSHGDQLCDTSKTAEAAFAGKTCQAIGHSTDARGVATGGSAAVIPADATGGAAADVVAPAGSFADPTVAAGTVLPANHRGAVADDAATGQQRENLTRETPYMSIDRRIEEQKSS